MYGLLMQLLPAAALLDRCFTTFNMTGEEYRYTGRNKKVAARMNGMVFV